jgi:DNA-binding response OmpR family regulator
MTRVLVIDDEPDFVQFMTEVLTAQSFAVTSAEDGVQGLERARTLHPDLIFLDWNLPGKDGLTVCKELKADEATRSIPVILLTARGREADVVLGLEMGADDYIAKRALRPRELVARARTALRKAAPGESPTDVIVRGGLRVDAARRRVTLNDQVLDLRSKEFDLLLALLRAKGRVLTRAHLTETVWGAEFFGTSRTVDTTAARLRAKLGDEGRHLQAEKGLGYKFEET